MEGRRMDQTWKRGGDGRLENVVKLIKDEEVT